MKNTKSTRRSLYSSLVSLVLCVAMLVGSTFAWFTDVVTTGKNTIATGNLDVGLKYSLDFKSWEDVSSSTVLFSPDTKWEPGHVEVVYLEVENKGELAFYYRVGTNLITNQLGKNQENGEIDLTEIIEFAIIPVEAKLETRDSALASAEGEAIGFSNYFIAEESLNENGETAKYAMVVWMPEDAGDAYNHNGTDKPALEFGIKVIASQKPYEEDSFGSDYDTDSAYPNNVSATYTPATETVIIGEGFKATIPASVTLYAAGVEIADATTLEMSVEKSAVPNPEVDFDEYNTVDTYEISLITADGESVTAENGTITVELYIGKNKNGATLYHNSEEITGTYDAESGIITFTTGSFSPFTVVENAFTIYTLEEFKAFGIAVNGGRNFAGYLVRLGADIDLNNEEWTSIGTSSAPFSGSFDGQGYTISNLKITKTVENLYSSNRQGLFGTIKPVGATYFKNLTLHNADITAGYHVGAVIATSDGSSQSATGNYLVVTDINLTGLVKVYGWEGVGGVMGSGNMAEISNITVDVEEGSYVTTMPDGRTNSFACVGSVKGGGYFAKADNIISNMDVTAKTAGTGGLFGVIGGQTVACYLSNLYYSGTVTLTESSVDLYGTYSNYQYNGLLVGSSRYTVIADEATCTSDGNLVLVTENEVFTSNNMSDAFVWGADLFGASRDKTYTNKSYAKTYTDN